MIERRRRLIKYIYKKEDNLDKFESEYENFKEQILIQLAVQEKEIDSVGD